MLKNIRIFGIVLLVAILAIVVAVWACDDLKAALKAAKIARNAAEAEQTPTPDAQPSETTWDSQTAYQDLRETYPD